MELTKTPMDEGKSFVSCPNVDKSIVSEFVPRHIVDQSTSTTPPTVDQGTSSTEPKPYFDQSTNLGSRASTPSSVETPVLRRSTRQTKPVERLGIEN